MAEIYWLPWDKKFFLRARKERKLVFLDIFGIWCHYCNKMDENYKDPRVISRLNADFVPMKVDTDKMPDVNRRYNQGGWPSLVFLDGDAEMLAGTTYLEPDDLLRALDAAQQLWEKKLKDEENRKQPKCVRLEIVKDAQKAHRDDFDPIFGGFGPGAKFPNPEALEFFIVLHRLQKNVSHLTIVEKSLSGILEGLYDKEEGGFFRYSTTRDWKSPHYEKILETNADMIGVLAKFLDGVSRSPRLKDVEVLQLDPRTPPGAFLPQGATYRKYADALDKTVDYVLRTLRASSGGFYGSQDADGEDRYYGQTLARRRELEQPKIDHTIFCDLNGKMICALVDYVDLVLRTSTASIGKKRDIEVLNAAEKAAVFLMKNCWSAKRGAAHYYDGGKSMWRGLLLDNVWLARALLRLAEVSGKKLYEKQGLKVCHFLHKAFRTPNGSLADRLRLPDDVGRLKVRYQLAGENAEAALLFFDVAKRPGQKQYREMAKQILDAFSGIYKQDIRATGGYAKAVAIFFETI